ncbi:MAG: hypothetical protein E6Q80_13720, partial [Thauera aminoaromatica]
MLRRGVLRLVEDDEGARQGAPAHEGQRRDLDAAKLFERGSIEIAPLAFMRGRTLNHAFIILDEAQNTTKSQMLMFLTRLGEDSKCVVTGDPTQVDLRESGGSGLVEAMNILPGTEGVA